MRTVKLDMTLELLESLLHLPRDTHILKATVNLSTNTVELVLHGDQFDDTPQPYNITAKLDYDYDWIIDGLP